MMQAILLARVSSKEQEEGQSIPAQVQRLTDYASLCGYFLSIIPHPYCQGVSKFLIVVGLEMCVEAAVSRAEENEQKGKDQKNR